MTPNWGWVLLVVQTLLGLGAAWHALLNKRDSRSALGWMVVALGLPIAGPVAYLLFGINRVRARARRSSRPSPAASAHPRGPGDAGLPVSELSDLARAGAQLHQGATFAVLSVNLDGVFYTCRAAIPHFSETAAIVNVASMAGHRGSVGHADYAAAKGAVLNFSRTLAMELAPRVRVNSVSPGLIDTPMVRGLMDANGAALIAGTPAKRLGTPQEVARVVAFLASDWASFVTGETVHVNGGLYIAS